MRPPTPLRNGFYLHNGFRMRRHGQRQSWPTQAVPRLIPSEPLERRGPWTWHALDVLFALLLGLGLAASLLLAIALVLGAGWLVARVALELVRLVHG